MENILIERTISIKRIIHFLESRREIDFVPKSLGIGDWGQQRFKAGIIDNFTEDYQYDEALVVKYPLEEMKVKFKKDFDNDVQLMSIINGYIEIDSGYYDGSDEERMVKNEYFLELAQDGFIFRDYELCEGWDVEEIDIVLEYGY